MEELTKSAIAFLNSNSFTGIATIITGCLALLVFKLQKRSEKIQAARIIIGEIRNAEEEIKRIKDTQTTTETPILPQNSWNKFSHLFSGDFDQDEISLINKFYASVELIQRNIQRLHNSIPLQADRKLESIQETLVKYASEAETKEDYDRKKGNFLKIIKPEGECPFPEIYKNNILKYLGNINPVLTTSAGQKLKILAEIQ